MNPFSRRFKRFYEDIGFYLIEKDANPYSTWIAIAWKFRLRMEWSCREIALSQRKPPIGIQNMITRKKILHQYLSEGNLI